MKLQEVAAKSNRKETENRKKALEVVAGQTVRSVCNAMLVEILSACSQFIEHARLFCLLTYELGPGCKKA